MLFSQTWRTPNTMGILALLAVSILVVFVGASRDYTFLPNRLTDGFAAQIEYIRDPIFAGRWSEILLSPLKIVHTLRFLAAWPFLAAEDHFGSIGSLSLLLLCTWPLVLSFRPSNGGWRDYAYMAARFLPLLLPLVVSGRTVLVIAGMGYLVSGLLARPFSLPRIMAGCFLAALSSASILFTIVFLLVGGGGRGRSRAFDIAKWVTVALAFAIFMPSLLAKIEGFSKGAGGYTYENRQEDQYGSDRRYEDGFGTGVVPGLKRVLARSTVAESYREGNFLRLSVYLGLLSGALTYAAWAIFMRRWNFIATVLCVLSLGIFIEGLALWPMIFPLVWAYTGVTGKDRFKPLP